MIRLWSLLAALLLASAAVAQNDPASDAYAACLIGTAIVASEINGMIPADAYQFSVTTCADRAALVPEGDGELTGPEAVEEYAIHFLENRVWVS